MRLEPVHDFLENSIYQVNSDRFHACEAARAVNVDTGGEPVPAPSACNGSSYGNEHRQGSIHYILRLGSAEQYYMRSLRCLCKVGKDIIAADENIAL